MTTSSSLNRKILLFTSIVLTGVITISCGMLGSDSSSAVDVSIANIEAPASATQGQTVNVNVTLENTGEEDISENITVTLENQTEEISIGSETVTDLDAADTAILTFSWNTEEAGTGEHNLHASFDLEDDNTNNNSGTTSVTIVEPEESDVAISEVNSPSSVTQGSEVDIEVTVENTGNRSIDEEFNVMLEDQTDGITIETQSVSSLEAGASTTLTYTWSTSDASTGDHELTATHSFEDNNSDNNSLTSLITVAEPEVNDIAVTGTSAPSSAEQGEEVNVEVTVENSGNQTVDGDFDVTLEDNTDGVTIGTQTVSGLEVGSSTTLTYTWNTGEATSGDHELEASHALDDDNADNNSATTTVTVNEPAVTDIAITETSAPSSVTHGETADIDVTVENIGNTDVSDTITITFMHHQETLGTREIEGGLTVGSSETVTYSWDTTGEGTGSPPHPIDVFHDVDDEDNSNNEDTVEILVEEP